MPDEIDNDEHSLTDLATSCQSASLEPANLDIQTELASAAGDTRLLSRFMRNKKSDALKGLIAYHRYMRSIHDVPDGTAASNASPSTATPPAVAATLATGLLRCICL